MGRSETQGKRRGGNRKSYLGKKDIYRGLIWRCYIARGNFLQGGGKGKVP